MNRIHEKSVQSINFAGKHLRVLDVGCGNGRDVLSIAAMRGDAMKKNPPLFGASNKTFIVGVDVDGAALNTANRDLEAWRDEGRIPSDVNVDFLCVDAAKLPFPDESFDHVRCQFVLLHARNAKKILQEMLRVVKRNGGQLVVIEGDSRSHVSYATNSTILEMEATLDKLAAKLSPCPTAGSDVSVWLRELNGKTIAKHPERLEITVDADALFTPKPSVADPGLKKLKATLDLGARSGFFTHEKKDAYLRALRDEEDAGAVMRTSIVFTTTCIRGK